MFVGNLEEKIPLGSHKHRWENNVWVNSKEIVCEYVNYIHVLQDRVKHY
jgi:hypothetical protein